MCRNRLWLVITVIAATCPDASSIRAAGSVPAGKITYEEHVLPVLRENCFLCHNQDRKRGGLRIDSYTSLMEGGASGVAIKPGDPDNSLLFKLVTHRQQPNMPPKSPTIPAEKIDVIKHWIEGGALQNSGSTFIASNKPKVDFTLITAAKGKPDGPPPMPPKLSLEPVVRTGRADAITALASSPWAPLIAVGGQQQVLLYQSDTLELLGILPFPEGIPRVLRFSGNGSLLLAGGGHGGKSGRVVVWSVRTGERLFEVGDELDCVLAADICADQSQVALAGPGKIIRVYSTRDGKLLREIKKHTDWVYAVQYSPDGVLLATADRSGGLFVWEANTGREFFSLRGHTAGITAVSWRPDSNVLASASEDATIRLWEMENGTMIKSWSAHGGVEDVRYAQDGRLVSCGRDHTVKVWAPDGNQQRAFEPLPDLALRAVFTHDSARVIAGDWSGQIQVWSSADGKLAGNLLANPPTLAERVELVRREIAARTADRDRLSAVAKVSQTAADKAAADLAAVQKLAADSAAALQAAQAATVKNKDVINKVNAALPAAQAAQTALQTASKNCAESFAKAKEAAEKAKDKKDLADAAIHSQQLAAQAAAKVDQGQKVISEMMTSAKNATDQLAQAQKAAEKATADIAAANKQVGVQTTLAKAAADKAAADKGAAAQAESLLVALTQKWNATLAQGKPMSASASPGNTH